MGWAPLPFTCQGPWKIYGDPTVSLGLAEAFRQSRCRMVMLSTSGVVGCFDSPEEVADETAPFCEERVSVNPAWRRASVPVAGESSAQPIDTSPPSAVASTTTVTPAGSVQAPRGTQTFSRSRTPSTCSYNFV